MQNTKFVYMIYFVYKDCIQINILYDNECTINVHQIRTYKQKMYRLYKVQSSDQNQLET